MSCIIIDGVCRERDIYAERVATATGYDLVTLPPMDTLTEYLDYMPETGKNIVINGFLLSHGHLSRDTKKHVKSLSYAAVGLLERLDLYYCVATNLEEFYITGTLDKYVKHGHLERIILSRDGVALAKTLPGTLRHQEKYYTLSSNTLYQKIFEDEKNYLFEKYGKII